jgi:hypothetical protein
MASAVSMPAHRLFSSSSETRTATRSSSSSVIGGGGGRRLAVVHRVDDAVGDAADEVLGVVPGLLARDVIAAHLWRRLLSVLLHLLDEGLRLRRLWPWLRHVHAGVGVGGDLP